MKIIFFSALLFSLEAFAANSVKLFVNLTPAGSFEAVSEKLKGNLIKKDGAFTADKLWVSVESFKTGIDLRDEHFHKHLKSSKAVMTDVKGSGGKATGTLELNGVKKPVSISYVEKGAEVLATFNVKASEFQLPKAQYLGVGVQDDIKVEVSYPYVAK